MKSKEGISGPCVACDMIVSFEAITCPHCGQPDAGEKAKAARIVWKAERPIKAEKKQVREIEFAIRNVIEKDYRIPLLDIDFEKVTVLHLQGGKWKSLEGLEKLSEKLTQLKELNLESNKLTEVKGLRKLSQLEKLELQYNKLTNLEGLDQLTQLKELWLRGNPDLTFVQIDKLQKALPKCIIFS